MARRADNSLSMIGRKTLHRREIVKSLQSKKKEGKREEKVTLVSLREKLLINRSASKFVDHWESIGTETCYD